MTTDVDTLSIPVQRLIVEEGASITGQNFRIPADVYNHGLIAGHWIRFAGSGSFVNFGTVEAVELLAIQDSCVNHGLLAVEDSLVVGYYKALLNFGQVHCNVIYNLNFLVNQGNASQIIANRFEGNPFTNDGDFNILNMLHAWTGFINYGTISSGSIFIWAGGFDNHGTIICIDTLRQGNGEHSPSTTIFSGSRVETGHLINSADCVIQGAGALCISGTSINEGTIRAPLRLCDYSPTNTEWPYLDVNTGTVQSGVQVCTAWGCSVGLNELTENAEIKVYPNPNADGFTIAFEGLPAGSRRIALLNALGQEVFTTNGPFSSKVVVPRNGLGSGLYQLSIQDENGHEVAGLRVVIADL